MRMSELQRKDIVDINDGRIVGRIIDADIDSESGALLNLVIERNKSFRKIFTQENDLTIKYNQIKKLGSDVILIDLS